MKNKITILLLLFVLSACSTGGIFEWGGGRYRGKQSTVINKGSGTYKIGNPYQIFGKWYYPKEDYDYKEVGVSSWYGADFHAKATANGEKYDMNTMTAAHRTLPLPSIVKVTNLENGKTAILRVNDRGPFAKNRIIDISKKGAQELGFHLQGTTKVKVEVMEKESRALKAALLGGTPEPKLKENNKIELVQRAAPIKPVQTIVETPKNGKYFVQVGAFNNRQGAENLRQQLSGFGSVSISEANIGGGTFYRVRLGPYNTEKTANQNLDNVRDFGIYNAKTLQD